MVSTAHAKGAYDTACVDSGLVLPCSAASLILSPRGTRLSPNRLVQPTAGHGSAQPGNAKDMGLMASVECLWQLALSWQC